MVCPSCGKNDKITIGNKDFCTHCGSPYQGGQPASVSPSPPPTQPTTQQPAQSAVGNTRQVTDVKKQAAPGVLDLRQSQSGTSSPPPAAKPAPTPAASTPPAPRPAPVIPSNRKPARQANAASVSRHEQVQRFNRPPKPVQPAGSELPNQAASAHQALQKLLGDNLPSKEVAPTAVVPAKSAPKPAALALTAVAVLALGAYIWTANYPKMAVKIAAAKAGLSASMPGYLPSSYSLNGSVIYGPGKVTVKFKSPSVPSELTLTQQQTNWDSGSLLDNFVTRQSSEYLAVQGQGLTVYLYEDSSKATWVNRGIWYTIEGATTLNREQILKIAYSL